MTAPGVARIVSVGARAALGLNVLQVAMNVRAGLSEPRACKFRDQRGRKIGMCRVGGVGGECFGYERLLALAVPALREAVAGRDVTQHAMVLALPSTVRPDEDPRFATTFAADLCARASLAIDPRRITVLRVGHAGGVQALAVAADQLASCPGVVVGGVDSYYHEEVLRWLDEGYRLHGLGVDDGFIPAEGAAFVLLERGRDDAIAQLVAVHSEREPAMLDESRPNLAEALTGAVKQVGGTGAKWVMHDANGEHGRQREWGMVALRHELHNGEQIRIANELGDLGAATAPMMAAVAATWWKVGCAPASRVLLLASSETAERAACILEEVRS